MAEEIAARIPKDSKFDLPIFRSEAGELLFLFGVLLVGDDRPAPLQEGAVAGLQFSDDYYSKLSGMYADKRTLLLNALRAARFKCLVRAIPSKWFRC